jgi:hypothetical protein
MSRLILLLALTGAVVHPREAHGLQVATVTPVAQLERDLRAAHARATALFPEHSGVTRLRRGRYGCVEHVRLVSLGPTPSG